MNYEEHIRLIRQKQLVLPAISEQWADRIFKEVLQGDELQDQIDELFYEMHNPEDFDASDSPMLVEDDFIDAVWANILHRLHQKVVEVQRPINKNHPTAQHLKSI